MSFPLPELPRRVRSADLAQLEQATSAFRLLDYRYGGGTCHDAVVTHLTGATAMLGETKESGLDVGRLTTAVADLHNLAGWTAFDTGRPELARRHFHRAMDLAAHAGNAALVANVLYRMGRVYLHHAVLDEALTKFELAMAAAEEAGSPRTISLIHANLAWTYAKMGLRADALDELDRCQREFNAKVPPWEVFFDETDLSALVGVVHTELGMAGTAIPALLKAGSGYSEDMTRSRAFTLISLATSHLLDGDADHAAAIGFEAVSLAAGLRTTRVRDRLRPLWRAAEQLRANPSALELAQRIRSLSRAG